MRAALLLVAAALLCCVAISTGASVHSDAQVNAVEWKSKRPEKRTAQAKEGKEGTDYEHRGGKHRRHGKNAKDAPEPSPAPQAAYEPPGKEYETLGEYPSPQPGYKGGSQPAHPTPPAGYSKGSDRYPSPSYAPPPQYHAPVPAPKPYQYAEAPTPAPQPEYQKHSGGYDAAPKPSKRHEYEYIDPYGKPSPPPKEHEYYAPAPKPKDDYYAPKPKDEYYAPKPKEEYYAPKPKDDYYAPKPKEEYYTPQQPKDEYYKPPAQEPYKYPEAPAKPAEPAPEYYTKPGYQPAPADKPQGYIPPKDNTPEPEYYYKPEVDGYSKDGYSKESEYYYAKSPEGQQYYPDEYYSKDGDCGPGRGGHHCEMCPTGTYSPGGKSVNCIPCGPHQTSPRGSTSVSMCTCMAGFGATFANPDACSPCPVGTYNPDPLTHPSKLYLQEAEEDSYKPQGDEYDGDNKKPHLPPHDLVAARPNIRRCTPCDKGFSTAGPQSNSSSACVADCPCGYGTAGPDFNECVVAPPGYWAGGGPLSDPDTRIRKCPSSRPVTVAEATCSPKHCVAPVQAFDDVFSFEPNSILVGPPGVLLNDKIDPSCPKEQVKVHVLTEPEFGTLTLNPDGGFSYRSEVQPNKADKFVYGVVDCFGQESNATVYLRPEAGPLAVDDTFPQPASGNLVVEGPGLLKNDEIPCGIEAAKIRIVTNPGNGEVTVNSNGGFQYKPKPTANGLNKGDMFTYEVSCPNGLTSSATVRLPVPPALTDDSFQQDPSGITYVPPPGLLKNDDIPCGDKAKITLVPGSGPKYGSVEMGEGGGFTYTSGNPAKTDSFQYEVDCGDGLKSRGVVTLPAPPAPKAKDDTFTQEVGGPTTVNAPGVLDNDDVPCEEKATITIVTPPKFGTVGSIADDGSFTYTPGNPQKSDQMVYEINCLGKTSRATVFLPVPQPDPVANDDSFVQNPNGPTKVPVPGVLANDEVPCGDKAVLTVTKPPSFGSVYLDDSGSFVYSPSSKPAQFDAYEYQVECPGGQKSTATVYLPVPPALKDDSFPQDPSGVTEVPPPGVLNNDDIPCGDAAIITLVPGSGPKYGTVEMGSGGGFTYNSGTPPKADSFQYEVDCGDGLKSRATVTLPAPPAPKAVDDSYPQKIGTPTTINALSGLLKNDTVPCGSQATVTVVSQPQYGSITAIADDGSFTYTPMAGQPQQTDEFTYEINCLGQKSRATVTLPVPPPAPVANDDTFSQNPTGPTRVNPSGVLANDQVPCGNQAVLTVTKPPSFGSVFLDDNGGFVYNPSSTPARDDLYEYQVECPGGVKSKATVYLPAPPVAVDDTYGQDKDGITTIPTGSGILKNDSVLCGSDAKVTLKQGPSHGTIPSLTNSGSFTYSSTLKPPEEDDFFIYTVECNGLKSDATVYLPAPPRAVEDIYPQTTNGATTVVPASTGILNNDIVPCGTDAVVAVVTQPTFGKVVVAGDGSFSYTPYGTPPRDDAFQYSVTCNGMTSTTTVSLPVPPTAVDDLFVQPASGPTTIPKAGVLGNDTVPCGNTATVRVISGPSSGGVTVNNDGSFVYTPNAGPADDEFTYEVNCNGYTSTATVKLPARPVAVNDKFGRDFGPGQTVIPGPGVLANDVAPCGNDATVSLLTQPSVGTVVLNADGGFTYTNTTPVSGSVTFTYQLACPGGLVSTATVTLTEPVAFCNYCSSKRPIWFIQGAQDDTLQLWRWDPPFASTQAQGPKVVSSLTVPGSQINGGDVINTAKGEPLMIGQSFVNLGSSGQYVSALYNARPLSATYTAADMWPFYFGSSATPPSGFTWDWGNVACLESSPSAYNVDLGYALCSHYGNRGSWILTFSTKLSNRAEVVCNPLEATDAHRGWGDVSLTSDRELYINGRQHLWYVAVDPETACPINTPPVQIDETFFPKLGTLGNSIAAEDGAATFCLNDKTYILPFACQNDPAVPANVCAPWGVSLLPPANVGGTDWTVSDFERVPVTFGPAKFPYNTGAEKLAVTFGGSNEPECNNSPTTVTAVADTFPVSGTSGAATTIQAPGMLANDDVPWDCRPLAIAAATVTGVTQPSSGSVTFTADGKFTYTAGTLPTSFTYTMSCKGQTSTATVSLTAASKALADPSKRYLEDPAHHRATNPKAKKHGDPADMATRG